MIDSGVPIRHASTAAAVAATYVFDQRAAMIKLAAAGGLSIRQIAKKTGMSKSSVALVLKNVQT
jgi:transposase